MGPPGPPGPKVSTCLSCLLSTPVFWLFVTVLWVQMIVVLLFYYSFIIILFSTRVTWDQAFKERKEKRWVKLVLLWKEHEIILQCSIVSQYSRKRLDSGVFFLSFQSLGPIGDPNTKESCWFFICWYTKKRQQPFLDEEGKGEKCQFGAIFSWLLGNKLLRHPFKSLSQFLWTLVLNRSTDFILCDFHSILWVNRCVIYSLTILNGCPVVCLRIYTGIMGLLKVLNLGLDSAVKVGSHYPTFLIVSCLLSYITPKFFWNIFMLI